MKEKRYFWLNKDFFSKSLESDFGQGIQNEQTRLFRAAQIMRQRNHFPRAKT